MEDRRSAFPTHDPEPQHNILDGPHMRTDSDPINVVHKRYWALLAVGLLLVGLFSFYAPASMMSALHCEKDETAFVYAPMSGDTLPERGSAQPLSAEGVAVLNGYKTAHMIQKDAVFSGEAIVVYPAEDTNYALYATAEASYVFALDAGKFRYQVKDDGAFYEALCDATDCI